MAVQNSRTLLRAFGGLNETYGCTEAEYSAGMNFSARNFPALSTRTPRRKLREVEHLNGMYHLNGLLTVCGEDLVYTPDEETGQTVTLTGAVKDSRKVLVGIGTKILIFPDKKAFDTAEGSVADLGALWSGKSVTFAPCDAEGKTYTVTEKGRTEPEKPGDGQLFLKVEDEAHPWSSESTLEVYSAAANASAKNAGLSEGSSLLTSTSSNVVPYSAARLRSQGRSDGVIRNQLMKEGYSEKEIQEILRDLNS